MRRINFISFLGLLCVMKKRRVEQVSDPFKISQMPLLLRPGGAYEPNSLYGEILLKLNIAITHTLFSLHNLAQRFTLQSVILDDEIAE